MRGHLSTVRAPGGDSANPFFVKVDSPLDIVVDDRDWRGRTASIPSAKSSAVVEIFARQWRTSDVTLPNGTRQCLVLGWQ